MSGGSILCNSSSSLSSTGWERITVTPTVSHAPQLRHVGNAPVQTAHRSSCFKTMPRPVARKMPIWCRFSREKTGLLNSTMTYHNRLQFLETHSASRLSSVRTLCASHCIHGLLLASFHHGLRLRACSRNSVRCGITATIYRLTTMAFCGAREVHRAHFYSYWSPRPVANSYSCLTMLPYLVAIWAGPEP